MKMGILKPLKRSLPWAPIALLLLLPIALFHLYPIPFLLFQAAALLPRFRPITITSSPIPPPPTSSSSSSSEKDRVHETKCDYFDGEWVRDTRGPLYNNGTACEIKKSQNCILNGRPDTGYLHWRWKPKQCHLPRFEPLTFLRLVRNKHVAFVGDSFARNQFQSLLCMLVSAASTPKRVFKEDSEKWYFPTHNANFTLYWSPFLVQGVRRRKVTGPNCNTMYLDRVHERWARDVNQMDMIVLSFGVWFLLPSVYIEGGSVLGSFKCPEFNHTRKMDFYEPLGKSVRTSLNRIFKTKGAQGSGIDIIVKTFSPAHFEGDWDKGGTCSIARPYRKKEKQLDGVNAEIRRIMIEEVESAKPKAKELGFKLEALDVTKLALLRPDGHPGPYMKHFPFANGVPEHVQSDCSHWCLPGPIDTWNEIFLEMLKKWEVPVPPRRQE
ncbi:hypothetical protein OROMI_025174 [Orobanche minor]